MVRTHLAPLPAAISIAINGTPAAMETTNLPRSSRGAKAEATTSCLTATTIISETMATSALPVTFKPNALAFARAGSQGSLAEILPGEMPLASKPLMMADAMAPAPMKPMLRLCNGEVAMALIACELRFCGYPKLRALEIFAAPTFCDDATTRACRETINAVVQLVLR